MRAKVAVVGLALLAGGVGGCGDGGSGSDGPPPATLDFQVNASTAGDQSRPAVVELVGGDIVIAWRSSPPDGGPSDVRARVLSADLARAGEELVVSDPSSGAGILRGPAPLADGGFLVTWWIAGTQRDLARRYGADGSPVGEPYEIDGGLGDASAISGDGRVIVAEELACPVDSPGGVEWFGCVRVRRTLPDGTLDDSGFAVSDPNYNYLGYFVDQERPSAAANIGGEFVVVWSEEDWYYGHHGNYEHWIYARRFNPDASMATAPVRAAGSGYLRVPSAVEINDGGDFVVVTEYCSNEYESYDRGCFYRGIGGSRTTKDGDHAPFNVVGKVGYVDPGQDDAAPAAGLNAAGEFVVVWERTSSESGESDIMARLFEPTAVASGVGYRVNADAPGQRCCADAVRLAGGDVVVVWQSEGEDGDGAGIFAKRLP